MMDLDSIGCKYKTDKSSLDHNYLNTYSLYFESIRNEPVNILEIGFGGYDNPCLGGNSIYTWLEYFPKAKITCLEYYPKQFCDDRVNLVTGSQEDLQTLTRLGDNYGPFDIIIDDGSHNSSHIITSFENLFDRYLTKNGIYVVEDTFVSYSPEHIGSRGISSLNYFKQLIHYVSYKRLQLEGFPIKSPIEWVHFYHQLLFIKKGESEIW